MKVCLRSEADAEGAKLQGWLTRGKVYVVLSVEQYSSDEIGLRIESEDGGQPVVFKASLFNTVDSKLPACWQVLALRPSVIELGPAVFGQAGFWESCFDRDPIALEKYRRAKEEVLAGS